MLRKALGNEKSNLRFGVFRSQLYLIFKAYRYADFTRTKKAIPHYWSQP